MLTVRDVFFKQCEISAMSCGFARCSAVVIPIECRVVSWRLGVSGS
jgi:hypothetical protein